MIQRSRNNSTRPRQTQSGIGRRSSSAHHRALSSQTRRRRISSSSWSSSQLDITILLSTARLYIRLSPPLPAASWLWATKLRATITHLDRLVMSVVEVHLTSLPDKADRQLLSPGLPLVQHQSAPAPHAWHRCWTGS